MKRKLNQLVSQVVFLSFLAVGFAWPASAATLYVSQQSANPVPPYADWTTAATNIQDAINAALTGDTVVVTNGIYTAGGKVMAGDLTNRVALDKALTVQSVNGAAVTTIRGEWDPSTTNGPLAVRCAWVTNGAVLVGFTLTGGATRTNGDLTALQSGGAIWGTSTNASIINCVLATNAAFTFGGGACKGTLSNCKVTGNSALYGGGAYFSRMNNCLVQNNLASIDGGGVYNTYEGSLVNCTIVGNTAAHYGGGVSYGRNALKAMLLKNCIVYFNAASLHSNTFDMGAGNTVYSCTASYTTGSNNILSDPQLLDGSHLSVASPCRGAGSPSFTTGTDLDGNAWDNPPSMGCEEVVESALAGPLAVTIEGLQAEVLVNRALTLTGHINGRAASLAWDFDDGAVVTNVSFITSHTWTNAGDYTVTFSAFNASNSTGVRTNATVHVALPAPPQLGAAMLATNGMQFQFAGQAGVRYVMEMATNLAPPSVWQPLQTNVCAGGTVQMADPATTDAVRFYRVRAE